MARIVLVVQPSPAGVSLTWADGPAAFAPYELPAKSLVEAARAVRTELGAVVATYFSGESVDAPALVLANAGFRLFQTLFKPGAEQQPQAAEVRKWLDKLQTEGAVESLEIVAEGIEPVPWNLVYDHRPDPAAFKAGGDDPARWRPFWGVRYDLSGGRRVSPLRRFPVLQSPRVVVVSDPSVLDGLPTESRELAALCRDNGWPHVRSREELAETLQAGRPDLLYWLGHTQSEPFGLVLGEDVITPDELRVLMEGDPLADPSEVFGGVTFLNACGTAGGDNTGSFLDALHPLGMSGLIATEQVTIDTFAAPLGREFLTAFAVRGEPLGQVMRNLRGQVPLGLLYGSYCPSIIRVRRADEAPAPVTGVSSVVQTHVTGGKKLGRSPHERAATFPLPAHPYRSLRAYSVGDRALFAGRDDDVVRFSQVLDEPSTRLLILHGESGVGKTSFLRAGVIPFLENECVGYRFARDRSKESADTVLLVRATNDPASQIASALAAFCAKPFTYQTPAGAEAAADLPAALRGALGGKDGPDAVRDALRADPAALGRVLAELARILPFTPVLVIDQAEEMFTLARTPADEANRAHAMEMLRRAATGPGGFKIVVSLRTEYHGRLTDRLRKGSRDAGGVRDYLLTDFGLDALIEVIRRPASTTPIAYAAEVPAEKYRFRYADGVAEEVARRARAYTINRQDSVLPLVQVICSQLYDRAKANPDGLVTLADLDAIGGVEGGMKQHAEELVRRLFPRSGDQAAFKRLLADPATQLFIRQSDGTLTTALLPADFLARHWAGRMPFEDVLRVAGDGAWRLLRVNSLRIGSDEQERPYVSLGHDALAQVAAKWYDEQKRWAQLRKYAAAVVVLVVVAGALATLTGWALEAANEAKQSAQRANEERLRAEDAKWAAEFERSKAAVAKKLADEERDKAEKAENEILASYRASTEDAIDLISTNRKLGLGELTYLENTRKRWDEFAKRQGTDERSMAIRAEGQHRAATLLGRLGNPEEARKGYLAARKIWVELVEKYPAMADYKAGLASTEINLGALYAASEEWEDAQRSYQTALTHLTELVNQLPNVPRYRNSLARTHNNKGVLFAELALRKEQLKDNAAVQQFREKALDEYQAARELREKLASELPDELVYQSDLAATHRNLGLLLTDLGKEKKAAKEDAAAHLLWTMARKQYEAALSQGEKLIAKSPKERVYQNFVAQIHNDRGVLFDFSGDLEQARKEFALAHDKWKQLLELHPGAIDYKINLARSCLNYGLTLSLNDKLTDRRQWLDQAIQSLKPAPEKELDDGAARLILRDTHENRAIAYERLQKFPLAVADWDRAVELSAPAEQPRLRARRTIATLGAGRVDETLKAVDAMTQDPKAKWTGDQWYDFAWVYAVAGGLVKDETKQMEYGKQAVKLLRDAMKVGWKDSARLETDAGFNVIRSRLDFVELSAELRSKTP